MTLENDLISIIVPAFDAQATLTAALHSVGSPGEGAMRVEFVIVSDDGHDYTPSIRGAGIEAALVQQVSTGRRGAGSAAARNVGFDAARGRYVALLDADDQFGPGKLAAIATALRTHPFVSTALDVRRAGTTLRHVGHGPRKLLPPAAYKFTNISMDAMIAWDRTVADPRSDAEKDCLTDLDLVLRLFEANSTCLHLGDATHVYNKQAGSISNSPQSSVRYVRMKKRLIGDLQSGRFPMADRTGPEGVVRFLKASLDAEQDYSAALKQQPDLIFEDHLTGYLRAASTASR